MNSGSHDIGSNFLLNQNNSSSSATNPLQDQHPDLLTRINDSSDTENGWASSTGGGLPTTSTKNHVFLNNSFDFVLPSSSASTSQQPTQPSNDSGLVEGTLIDLIGEGAPDASATTAAESVAPENLTNGAVNHHHQLGDEHESVHLFTSITSQESQPIAGHSDDEDILCMYSSESGDKQHLLSSSNSNNHFDGMDRESEPLISYNRGRLGSTDVTLTISVPGKLGNTEWDRREAKGKALQLL